MTSLHNVIQLMQNLHATITGITTAPNVRVTTWQASNYYVASRVVKPTTANGYYYQAGGNGQSGSSEPTWPTTLAATVIDGGITWTCIDDTDPGGWPTIAPAAALLPMVLTAEGTGQSQRIAGDSHGVRNLTPILLISEDNQDNQARDRNTATDLIQRFWEAYLNNYYLGDDEIYVQIDNHLAGAITDTGFTRFENFYQNSYHGVQFTVRVTGITYGT